MTVGVDMSRGWYTYENDPVGVSNRPQDKTTITRVDPFYSFSWQLTPGFSVKGGVRQGMAWTVYERDGAPGEVDASQSDFSYTPSVGLGVGWEVADPISIDLALNVANLASSAAFQAVAVATSLVWEMGPQ